MAEVKHAHLAESRRQPHAHSVPAHLENGLAPDSLTGRYIRAELEARFASRIFSTTSNAPRRATRSRTNKRRKPHGNVPQTRRSCSTPIHARTPQIACIHVLLRGASICTLDDSNIARIADLMCSGSFAHASTTDASSGSDSARNGKIPAMLVSGLSEPVGVSVVSLAEQWTESLCVGGSSLPLTDDLRHFSTKFRRISGQIR